LILPQLASLQHTGGVRAHYVPVQSMGLLM